MLHKLYFGAAIFAVALGTGEAAAQSREEAAKLKTELYSVTLESTDLLQITDHLHDAAIVEMQGQKGPSYGRTTTLLKEPGRIRIKGEPKGFFRGAIDIEVNCFVEPAADRSEAHVYVIGLQGSHRTAVENVPDYVDLKEMQRVIRKVLPEAQDHFAERRKAEAPAPKAAQ